MEAGQNSAAINAIKELIQTAPPDPFSSETLRFRNETYQFYSVGSDIDDDGSAHATLSEKFLNFRDGNCKL